MLIIKHQNLLSQIARVHFPYTHLMVVSRRARGGDTLTVVLRENSVGAHENTAYNDLMIEP
jgi:hypothetical protein